MADALQPEPAGKATITTAIRLALARPGAGIESGPFCIGVTGHRWNRIAPSAAPALSVAFAGLFAVIDKALPGRALLLATGMAEGTDLTAALARPAHWRLDALLPLPLPDWRAHLAAAATGDPAEAVTALDAALSSPGVASAVLPPDRDGRPDYAGLAATLAARCDVLVAVWDGEPALPGGTGDVARMAEAAGKPVIRLWPDDAGTWRVRAPGFRPGRALPSD